MVENFVKLTKHQLKEVFDKENAFRDWLVENMNLLNDLFSVSFHIEGTEVSQDKLRVDILASFQSDEENGENDFRAVIEIQLGRSDSKHLGQLITYGSQHDARYCIWIAEEFIPGHLSTLEILNEMGMDSDRTYFAVKAEILSIEKSKKVVNLKFDHKSIELPITANIGKRRKDLGIEQDLIFTFYDEIRVQMEKFSWFNLFHSTKANYYQFNCLENPKYSIQIGWRFIRNDEYGLLIDMYKRDLDESHDERLSTKLFLALTKYLENEYQNNTIKTVMKPNMKANKLYVLYNKKVNILELNDEVFFDTLVYWSVSEMEKFYKIIKNFTESFEK